MGFQRVVDLLCTTTKIFVHDKEENSSLQNSFNNFNMKRYIKLGMHTVGVIVGPPNSWSIYTSKSKLSPFTLPLCSSAGTYLCHPHIADPWINLWKTTWISHLHHPNYLCWFYMLILHSSFQLFRSNEQFSGQGTYFANWINFLCIPSRLVIEANWETLYFIQTLHTPTSIILNDHPAHHIYLTSLTSIQQLRNCTDPTNCADPIAILSFAKFLEIVYCNYQYEKKVHSL